jgi:gamma-glutamylcyclotransferase (GGCT)/AIG2-like uncharacterized protein YtfP
MTETVATTEHNVAFYGSLRKGCYNYNWFKEGLTLIGQSEIPGYKLFSLGSFPCIIPSDNPEDKVVVDLFKADESTFHRIHRMEIGAGYRAQAVTINEEDYIVYEYPRSRAEHLEDRHVPGGDWVKHLESNNVTR